MDPIYAIFARNVRTWRQRRGLSQEELGERTGLGRATIASIEGCRQAVALHQALLLARALEMHMLELTEGADDELENLRGFVTDEDLRKIVDMSKGLR
ncbi:MAG TPA: helix-turn-helix transcriptional regulator [Ramlibacter sp.]|uniref:helix-turn-helix domain-containing protein n=1 Tax=Ramlibacter sp. TaxID=1917967 RepID=UPI002BFDBD97|nr:helix-turn-helix transcriptional regulator [Ramlibacter sp.]HVZ42518.1 helix-turn-helix transcriptional regulator [Ramlibacter sp.]